MTEVEIYDMLIDSPTLNKWAASELLKLAQSHMAVRVAITYALQISRDAETKLRNVETLEELKFEQGVIAGTSNYVMGLISLMAEVSAEEEGQKAVHDEEIS